MDEDVISRTLAMSRRLKEELDATVEESRKIIERSYQLIDESYKVIETVNRILNDPNIKKE